jgi:hypothetical protein
MIIGKSEKMKISYKRVERGRFFMQQQLLLSSGNPYLEISGQSSLNNRPLNTAFLFSMLYAFPGRRRSEASAKGQEIHRFKQIGFSLPVAAYKESRPFRRNNLQFLYIAILK